ncbi:hypothetical protein WNY61_03455 [Sulfitobacter sp. AS92]|uniref:hypothetical protein n=1 Tax=Sulfitobacter sp. AS92 TaxID=3135783 RepID=UPI00316B5CEC
MSDPVHIDDRYSHIQNDGPNWRIQDREFAGEEFDIPKRFAATPGIAVKLLEHITEKQQQAIEAGFRSGRKFMQHDLRNLLGLNRNTAGE